MVDGDGEMRIQLQSDLLNNRQARYKLQNSDTMGRNTRTRNIDNKLEQD